MTSIWRVLLIEDSPTDAKLILAELKRSGKSIELVQVDNELDLRRCLKEGRWDIVLSDWSLPGFDAPSALGVLKELVPDLPFIIISGTVGEEMAVEAMRAGANDYVLKDRIVRLLPAVERELRESESRQARRHAERALERSQEQFRQAQKMEAVGTLAAGVAHDFNNLLSVILGYAELLVARLAEDDPVRHDIEQIDSAAHKASDLTRRLLMFSRQHVLELETVDMNVLVKELECMLARVLGEDVALSFRPAGASCMVWADRSSLEQVLMNLVVNARDAMPNGGKLTIETAVQDLDRDYAHKHLGVKPGRYVAMVVTDTGVGMDADTQARIFEPFFTTKGKNAGTGLGLSTVLGIVQQSEGSIWVYSEPGVGTSFKIFLPCVQEARESVRPKPTPSNLSGDEVILLVEDENQVREIAARILRELGYRVIEANGFSHALGLCESHAGPIQLLLTDVVMPDMSGPELAAQLLRVRPEMKVLYMSGYTDHAVLRHGVLREGIAYLQKPLTPTSLGVRVREVLDLAQGDEPVRP